VQPRKAGRTTCASAAAASWHGSKLPRRLARARPEHRWTRAGVRKSARVRDAGDPRLEAEDDGKAKILLCPPMHNLAQLIPRSSRGMTGTRCLRIVQAEPGIVQRLHHLHDPAEVIVVEFVLGIAGGGVEPRCFRGRVNDGAAAADVPREPFRFSQQDTTVALALAAGVDRDQPKRGVAVVQAVDTDRSDRRAAEFEQERKVALGVLVGVVIFRFPGFERDAAADVVIRGPFLGLLRPAEAVTHVHAGRAVVHPAGPSLDCLPDTIGGARSLA